MTHPRSLTLLALGAFLAACAEAPTSPPELQTLGAPTTALGGRVVQAVRGSGHLTVAGELRTFTFNAERRDDGSVSGEFQIIARQVDRVTHGQITCMSIIGSAAWLGGVIDRDNSGVTTGHRAVFRVVDLGQEPGGSPDLLSLVLTSPNPNFAQPYCNARPPAPPLMPTEGGEISITQPGSTSFTSSAIVPITIAVVVPCALDGAGEIVELSGNLHTLVHFTDDGSGGFHVTQESNPQGVSGVGLTSGDTYHGTGVTRSNLNSGEPLPLNQTFVNNFLIIGEGTGNNLLVHMMMHLTVNANGVVTATADNFSVECR